MIGYYVHHHGRGHLSRALAIRAALDTEMTVLSSLPRPSAWEGQWLALPLDDESDPVQPEANGRLHWAPLASAGLRDRMAMISGWIAATRPDALVVDVSVEVAVLARLHGTPVVTVALPGRRDDPAHELAFDVSSAIIAAWPPEAEGMLAGLTAAARERLRPVGAIGRYAPDRTPGDRARTTRRVLVLSGAGGDDFSGPLAAGSSHADDWEWTHLGGSSGRWIEDPWNDILSSDVVVTHAGEGILAEVSAARRPAIVLAQRRPHDEQSTTAGVLGRSAWPVLVPSSDTVRDWPSLLDAAARLDGDRWRTWNDGRGAERAAAVITAVARGQLP